MPLMLEQPTFSWRPLSSPWPFISSNVGKSGLVHCYLVTHADFGHGRRFKCFKVTALYPFCGALFTAGFACRLYETRHYDNIPVYIASQCLIYFAP